MANKSNCYKVKGKSIATNKSHAEIKSEESSYFKGLFGPKFRKNNELIIPWAECIAPTGFTINGNLLDIALPETIPTLLRGVKYATTDGLKNRADSTINTLEWFTGTPRIIKLTHPNADKIEMSYNKTNDQSSFEKITFTSENFSNGIVPNRLIFFLQGAGGGGGGGDFGFGGQPGSGGGAGGFWFGIVRLEVGDKIQINLGNGGDGGAANANNATKNRGKDGEQSSIVYTPSTNSGRASTTIFVNGGTGGEGGESGSGQKAGERGTIEIKEDDETSTNIWTILSSDWSNVALPDGTIFKGGNGKGGTMKNWGSDQEAIILMPYPYSSYNKIESLSSTKDLSVIKLKKRSGGKNGKGGGGAASVFAEGGIGGRGNGEGHSGGDADYGAGGGGGGDGGQWAVAAGDGGDGGNACLLIW